MKDCPSYKHIAFLASIKVLGDKPVLIEVTSLIIIFPQCINKGKIMIMECGKVRPMKELCAAKCNI